MIKQEFIDEISHILGDEADAFLATYEQPAHRGLRFRDERRPRSDLEDPVPWAANAYYIGSDDEAGKDPLHAAGAYYIQEPSAMVPATALASLLGAVNPDFPFRVLDLCAAPGGKTTQLAGLLPPGSLLIANEIHPGRAKILSENVERMGLANVIVISADPKDLRQRFSGYFHGILVDAPCSGEGMFRKNPDAIAEWSPDNVKMCAERQAEILDCASDMLAAGGIMVYSTCTFSVEENEDNVRRMANGRFSVFDTEELCRELNLDGADPGPLGVRLWPHHMRGEGHFFAPLKAEGELSLDMQGSVRSSGKTKHSKTDEKVLEYFWQFWEELGGDVSGGRYSLTHSGVSQGRYSLTHSVSQACDSSCKTLPQWQINVSTSNVPLTHSDSKTLPQWQINVSASNVPLTHLWVLRNGLNLGSVRKDRFIPSHALAHYLDPVDFPGSSVSVSREDAFRYLRGETLALCDDERADISSKNGWVLVAYQGFSLGWGKITGNIIKNHYPKGLRSF